MKAGWLNGLAGAVPGQRCADTGRGNAVRNWTTEELDKIGAAQVLQIAALRPDGSLRRYTAIWVVRVGDNLGGADRRRTVRAVLPGRGAARLQSVLLRSGAHPGRRPHPRRHAHRPA